MAMTKEETAAKRKEYRKRTKEHKAEYDKKYSAKNKEKKKEYDKQYWIDNIDRIKEYKLGHYKENKEKILAKGKEYANTDKGKANAKKNTKKMNAKYPQERKARKAVSTAVRNGTLIKPDICSACGETLRIEAHHYKGYKKVNWLDVIWLCSTCHKAEHKKVKDKQND